MPEPFFQLRVEPLLAGDEQAACLLGIGKTYLRQLDSAGRIGPRPILLGKRRLWVVSQLRSWVAAGLPNREEWIQSQDKLRGKTAMAGCKCGQSAESGSMGGGHE